ncbi:MAG TPA: tautomerase family protein [Clostridia bacterium]|nr:tautomerase family protein [Clostridia bacterium]
MPTVKIHVSSTILPFQKPILVKEVRKSIVELLNTDERISQVILYEALPQLRSAHESRSSSFVYVEIIMYPGLSSENKKVLLQRVCSLVSKSIEIDMKDISCCIIEVPAENWYEGVLQN